MKFLLERAWSAPKGHTFAREGEAALARRIWRRYGLGGRGASSSRKVCAGMATPHRPDRRVRSATFVAAAQARSSRRQSPPAKSKPQRPGWAPPHRRSWCAMAARRSCSSLRRRCTWSLPACSGHDARHRAHRRAGCLNRRWRHDRRRDGRDRHAGGRALRGFLRSKQAGCQCRGTSQRMSRSTGRLRQSRSTRGDGLGRSTASMQTPIPAGGGRWQRATSVLI